MSYDGIQFGNRVDNFTERKLYAKVVDNILSSRTYFSRIMGQAKPFMGKTMDFTIKISRTGTGEWFTGLETLNTSATDTTIPLSYAQNAYHQPIAIPLVDAIANTGSEATIPLVKFKFEEAASEAVQDIGTALYGNGSANQILGLGALVDDGTVVGSIGGQSRSTYTQLKATSTASGGTLSLAKMATLFDTISASGQASESPNIMVTTKTIFSLYEQLLTPNVRASYEAVGYNQVPLRGDVKMVKPVDLQNGAGFNALTYRGIPMIADDACTSGVLFMLNERYFGWFGRTIVPEEFTDLEYVDLGQASTAEGVMAAPSKYHGFFKQKSQMMPNQAGLLGHLYCIGQLMTWQPRRLGKLTGITSV